MKGLSRWRLVLLLSIVAITALSTGALAETIGQPAPIDLDSAALYLKTGVVSTKARSLAEATTEFAGAPGRGVVQLGGPITPEQRGRLAMAGVVLGDYLPADAFIVDLDGIDPEAFAGLEFVRWIGLFKPEWKVDPRIGRRPYQTARRLELADDGFAQLVAVLFADEDVNRATGELELRGAEVLAETLVGRQWLIDLIIPLTEVDQLAGIEAIQYLEDAPEGSPRNDSNEWIVQSDITDFTPIWDAGIHGEDQVAGIIDGTMMVSHCSFDDSEPVGPTHRKVLALRDAGTENSHGTHVAGTVAGDRPDHGVADQYDGMAFAAKISFTNVESVYATPSTLHARLLDAHDDGARVHNNSWGDDTTTEYTTWCRQIDQFSYDYEQNLVVFAASNQVDGVKSPENAKNVLAVAATRDAPIEHERCGINGSGPTADGRRKPELLAPGCPTTSSSLSTCSFTGSNGNSMAAPAIAGAAILARQYYTDGYYPTGLAENSPLVPSGALLRATLINAGVDLTDVPGYPTDSEGWGRLLLDGSLYLPGDAAQLYVIDVLNADGLATGGETEYLVAVRGDAESLRITLAFTEPPASVSASDPVINNLDLEVTAPGGAVYKGNYFVGGESATGGTFDSRNSVERVVINTPAIGTHTVTVKGTAVNEGPQGYALVVNGEVVGDCNDNGVPDDEDVLIDDCNGNGVPDDCFGPELDCNGNLVPDACDLADETSLDCNVNGIPDECEDQTDCNTNGTLDFCEIYADETKDCNGNGVLDECDVAEATSPDCQPNGVPDECDVDIGDPDGNGQVSLDSVPNGIPDECEVEVPLLPAPPHDAAKNRYISLSPANADLGVAFQVELTASTIFPAANGVVGWIGEPDDLDIARVVAAPVVRFWDEAVVHVGDCEIAPASTYAIRSTVDEVLFSEPLTVGTIAQPAPAWWADCVGSFEGGSWTAPNGTVNFNDVTAAIQYFQIVPTRPHLTWVDLDGEEPNKVVSFADIYRIVLAFQGMEYPFTVPLFCP